MKSQSIHFLDHFVNGIRSSRSICGQLSLLRIVTYEIEYMQEKWLAQATALECDFYKFRDYYNKHKKCNCDIDDCMHFEKALVQVLGNRAEKICMSGFDVGLKIYYDMIKDD